MFLITLTLSSFLMLNFKRRSWHTLADTDLWPTTQDNGSTVHCVSLNSFWRPCVTASTWGDSWYRSVWMNLCVRSTSMCFQHWVVAIDWNMYSPEKCDTGLKALVKSSWDWCMSRGMSLNHQTYYNVTARLVDMFWDHGCVFIRGFQEEVVKWRHGVAECVQAV
jgi:hypothetical protein